MLMATKKLRALTRTATLLLVCCLLTACVGAGTLTGLTLAWDVKDVGEMGLCPISYEKMIVGCPVKPLPNATSVQEITPNKLIAMWGLPETDNVVNGLRIITFHQSLAWRGLVVFVIVPIPLLVPLGHNEAQFSFQQGRLVHVRYTENSLNAAVCGVHSEGPNGLGCIADWH